MISRKELAAEDLAIQETLSMSIERRLELLAALIVDRISEDQRHGERLYKKIKGHPNA
jgi:hypothetical protein